MKRVCVYCGSNPGRRPEYAEAAQALAKTLVKRDIALVYGGAGVGIMGRIADAVLAAKGTVIGVIPQALVDKEVAHNGLSELKIVASMHERKATMAELSDGFIALPGGLGTIEELFEILTWAQLGLHSKPCSLLNVAGYYNNLSAFLDHAVEERFVNRTHRSMIIVETDPDRLIERMESHHPPRVNKWLERNAT